MEGRGVEKPLVCSERIERDNDPRALPRGGAGEGNVSGVLRPNGTRRALNAIRQVGSVERLTTVGLRTQFQQYIEKA
jgi:hypothetical protein